MGSSDQAKRNKIPTRAGLLRLRVSGGCVRLVRVLRAEGFGAQGYGVLLRELGSRAWDFKLPGFGSCAFEHRAG